MSILKRFSVLPFASALLCAPVASVARAQGYDAAIATRSAELDSARTPDLCLMATRNVNSLREAKFGELRSRPDTPDSVLVRLKREHAATRVWDAEKCVARFPPDTLSATEFGALMASYLDAGKVSKARTVIAGRLASAKKKSDKAALLFAVILKTMQGGALSLDVLRLYEGYAQQLDGLGSQFAGMQSVAHTLIAGGVYTMDYGVSIRKPLMEKHIHRAYEIATSLTPVQRDTTNMAQFFSAYQWEASLAVDDGDYETGKAILRDGMQQVGKSEPVFQRLLGRNLRCLDLVGKPAPGIGTKYWDNAAAGVTQLDYIGKVTLIEHTMTWCMWCKAGYPGLRRLYDTYGSRGFTPVLLTYLEGRVDDKPVTLDEELAHYREHWVGKFGIRFPVAVLETQAADTTASGGRSIPPIIQQYFGGGPPGYLMVDKRGIVRHCQTGHNRDQEGRFAAMIEKLLKE